MRQIIDLSESELALIVAKHENLHNPRIYLNHTRNVSTVYYLRSDDEIREFVLDHNTIGPLWQRDAEKYLTFRINAEKTRKPRHDTVEIEGRETLRAFNIGRSSPGIIARELGIYWYPNGVDI